MNKLSKKQLERRDHYDMRIHDHFDELEAAIETFNEKVRALHAELIVPQVEALNTTLEEAKNFVDELHSEAEDYHSNRTDTWQEGEKGQAYNTWYDTMENVGDKLDEIAIPDPPDDLKLDSIIEELEREVMSEIPDAPEG